MQAYAPKALEAKTEPPLLKYAKSPNVGSYKAPHADSQLIAVLSQVKPGIPTRRA